MERKRIYLKNSFYSVLNFGLLVVLGFLVRKVLIENFPIEFTGYEALFTDIFTLLSLSDLGMESIVTYNLYSALSNDKNKIPNIMYLARRMYFLIAFTELIIGALIFFVLPLMFNKNEYDSTIIMIIYSIQILNLCLSYLTGYKRLLFVADQKEYVCLQWDSMVLVIVQIMRIFCLSVIKNYYIYVGLCIVQTLIQNIGICLKYNKEYGKMILTKDPLLKTTEIINKDIKNFMGHRVSAVIYAATDNIVITKIMGLSMAGYYSNYYMISKYTYSFASKIMKPMQAIIGNYLYSEDNETDKIRFLSKLNGMAFIIASFVCNSIIQLSSPIIEIWLGNIYILNNSMVVLLAINVYIAINQDFIYYYRNSFGEYDYDKKYMMMSAVMNLMISMILGKYIGLNGIVIGTIVGHLFIWYGRIKFVYIMKFKCGLIVYCRQQICFLFLLLIQYKCVQLTVRHIRTGSIGSIIMREIVVITYTIIIAAFIHIIKYRRGVRT